VTKRIAALAGLATAAVALGIGELVAAVVAPRSAPLVVVGGVVIDNVPPAGKDLAVQLFGTNDKFALQIGTIILLALFAAVVGVLGSRRLWWGLVGVGLFGVIGFVSALTRAGADWVWALPSLFAAGAGAGALVLLLRLAPVAETGAGRSAVSPLVFEARRRRFLTISGGTIVGMGVLGFFARMSAQSNTVSQAQRAEVLPTPSGGPAQVPAGADVAGLTYVTDNGDFYRIDTAIEAPLVDPASWTLKVSGMVANPFTISFSDLLRMPMIERYVTLSCVSNEVGGHLIGNARWLGVPVALLLDRAQPDPKADQVVSRSVDGFTAGTPTAALLDGRDAMIAIAMNGEPLPVDHGFPARMVVPGLYGYVSATKWLSELELTTFAAYDAYWVPRGWAQQAPIKTESRIDRPADGAAIAPGTVVIAGVAWAPHRGIEAVEVQVDNGPWQKATLGSVASVDTWVLWSLSWSATRGQHQLRVRATDGSGVPQTENEAPPPPDGATGWHTIHVSIN
jgi:DMSO/TMAO reductase YedYZ molybdopterin-dependent catalytic subunit